MKTKAWLMVESDKILRESKRRLAIAMRFMLFIYKRFTHDKLSYTAAALTFTSLLSIVPLMSVSFAILKAFPAFQDMGNQISNFIFSNLVPTSTEEIRGYLDEFLNQSTQLTFVGSLFLFITALLTMWTIERAFNDIWRVQRSRRGVSAFMLYWAVLTMTPILFGVSLAVSSYVLSLPLISDTADSLGLRNQLLLMTSFLMEFAGLILLYTAVPNTRVRFKHAVCGGLVAAILFEGTKKCFALYITSFPTYQLLYGALATIPIFLVWVYLAWLIILFGAEITNALSYDHSEQRAYSYHKFISAYFWLGHLYQAQKKGEGLTLAELLQLQGGDNRIEPEEIVNELVKAQLVSQLGNGQFVLLKNLNEMTLLDLYHSLSWQLPREAQLQSKQHYFEQQLASILKTTDKAIDDALNVRLSDCYSK